ncbi:MAG: phosphotransferase, partial [Ramlibacter sp.]
MSDPSFSPAAAAGSTPSVSWSDPDRERAFHRWLHSVAGPHALEPATLRPASADASFRRYLRIDGAQGTRIVMDAPPDKEDCRPFVHVAQLMAGAGLLVPRVLAWDEPQGFMLLDDLGRQTMIEVVDP